MNTLYKFSLVLVLALLGNTALAQSKTDTTMIVNGVCGMCKNTIQKACNIDGVHKAEWDVDSKVLTLSYDAEKLNLQQISDSVNAAGYDTEYNTAPDEAYYGLHGCCHYRDPKVVEDHKK